MHVAAGRGLRRIDVGVGVDPDEADFLLPATIELGYTGDGAYGDGVVATQGERRHAFFERRQHALGGLGAGLGDLAQVAGICGSRLRASPR